MNLSDTFYVALCMTVLILGVVYWFWTQNQFVLRKLNLLNNIVFEMRAQQNKEEVPDGFVPPAVYAPAPGSEMGDDVDLLHEELRAEVETMRADAAPAEFKEPEQEREEVVDSAPENQGTSIEELAEPIDSELQPGGVGSNVKEIVSNVSNVLESMTIRELRRLAEQRGISGTSNMKKPVLIAALREKPVIAPFEGASD
jgi:hypothetical protein